MATSALLLFVLALIAQWAGQQVDPGFQILASKDAGKIIFIVLIFLVLGGFVATRPGLFRAQWLAANVNFMATHTWLKTFALFFVAFFCLHAGLLGLLYVLGVAHYNPAWTGMSLAVIGKILFGFIATFMLAWTEESIFRGTIYLYLRQPMQPLIAAVATSVIFMLAHDVTNPLSLVSTNWQLGLGLFLLGLLLNLVFIISGKLYAGMGIHAGLVFVKVVLRKARFLLLAPASQLPWLLHTDLRQAPVVHLLFALLIIGLLARYRRKLSAAACKNTR